MLNTELKTKGTEDSADQNSAVNLIVRETDKFDDA